VTEIQPVALPTLLAQSEQVARMGAGRPGPSERVERDEARERLARLSEQRSEEVQEAARVSAAGEHRERERDGGERGGGERRHPQDDVDGDDFHLVDLMA
jgi:hypothetical protein